MPNIFISYRREDNPAIVGRIYDRLETRFGQQSLFMDVDSIPLGVDFRKYLGKAIGKCDVVLVVIGNNWFGDNQDGTRRLNDPKDFVRIEIETALSRDIPVIPILIGARDIPNQSELPASLANLSYRNGIRIDSGRDFNIHVDRLLSALDNILRKAPNTDEVMNSSGLEESTQVPEIGWAYLLLRKASQIFRRAVKGILIAVPTLTILLLLIFGKAYNHPDYEYSRLTLVGAAWGLILGGLVWPLIPEMARILVRLWRGK